jgi:hypothetical protein
MRSFKLSHVDEVCVQNTQLIFLNSGWMGYIVVVLELDMTNGGPASTLLQVLRISNYNSATISFSFGTVFQQQLCNIMMSLLRRYLEWCQPAVTPGVHVRPTIAQQPHDL